MPATLALVIEGSMESGASVEGVTVEIVPAGRLEAEWRGLANRTDVGWFGGVRTPHVSRAFLATLVKELAGITDDGIAIPLRPAPGMPPLWNSVPLEIAQLVPEPQQTALLLCRNRSREEEPRDDSVCRVLSIDGAPQGILQPEELPSLVPEGPRELRGISAELDRLGEELARRKVPASRRLALLAGLWLLRDDLDRSHAFSQQIEGAEGHHGDYWHAIMHRREPDYGNSKYWFRRVGRHPTQQHLAEHLAAGAFDPVPARWREKLQRGGWDSPAFVDLCEQAESSAELSGFARRVQWCEMIDLLCVTAAAAA